MSRSRSALVLFRVPGRPRLAAGSWEVGTEHFTERFGLFVIIALGESIVLTGATTAELELDAATIVAFVCAFLGTAALWWLYFTSVAGLAERALARAENRTELARDAYTYGHVLIIAGILLTAVGDELVIAHPREELATAELITVVAGPALYLVAHAGLRLRMTGRISGRRVIGAFACAVVGLVGTAVSALVVGGLLVVVLVAVIAADRIAAARRTTAA
jgi:low temperature requirement protein LtrA